MPVRTSGPIGWWSPDPRGVLELDNLHVSRSMSRALHRFEIRVDTAFGEVLEGCADPSRPNGWIDERIRSAYLELYRLGWCHSVEAWSNGRLAGGLYGLAIGGLFAGESMFHDETNGSKAALIGLAQGLARWSARRMTAGPAPLIDVQWSTDHLVSMGVTEISRRRYLRRLPDLVAMTPSPMFVRRPGPTGFAGDDAKLFARASLLPPDVRWSPDD